MGPQPQDYELVKVYHPDATHGQRDLSPSVRNARFRAITHAYGVLRGRSDLSSIGGAWDNRDETMRAELWRRSRRSRSSSTAAAANSVRHESEDAQVWYSLVAFVLVGVSLPYSIYSFMIMNHPSFDPVHTPTSTFAHLSFLQIIAAMSSVSSHMDRVERNSQSAAANLAQARAEAQVHGMERRRMIRERVRSFHDAGETADGSGHPEMQHTSKVWQGETLHRETTLENVSKDERT
ncbi:hypothetical protein OG21DRAFT_816200 [Imleria badia]|nr:hypothetical protein OG21DRAFT_816200 [Imleria badia]